MKVFYENIMSIPNVESIKDLTQQEHLVLEFPKEEISKIIESNLIAGLKEKLPENYSVFNSGVWKDTVTITIKSVLSAKVIKKNLEFIKEGIKDYLDISKILLNNNPINETIVKEWELIEEHGMHNRYENIETGQVLETCSYPIIDSESIDPYFFGLFIKTSKNHTELSQIIKDTFHDSVRILEFIGDNDEIRNIMKQTKEEIEKIINNEILVNVNPKDDVYMRWVNYLVGNMNYPFEAEYYQFRRDSWRKIRVIGDAEIDDFPDESYYVQIEIAPGEITFRAKLLELRNINADEETLKAIEIWRYKVQCERKMRENIVPCADFSNQEDVLSALQYIVDNEWKRSEKMVAFVFESSTGETLDENAFYRIAMKLVGAPEIMAKITEKALNTYSIEYRYAADGLTNRLH